MTTIRWALASVLGLVFLVVATAVVFAGRVNQTLRNSDFYVQELRQADAFNFFYDKVLPPMLDDFEQRSNAAGRGNLAPAKLEAAISLRQIFPPAWLQTHSEAGIVAIVPYVVGEKDTFNVRIPLKPQTEAAGAAVKRLAGDEAILDVLFERVVARRLRETLGEGGGSGELPISAAAIEPHIREVLDNTWIESQVTMSVDAIPPYLISDQEYFQLKFDLATRKASLRKAQGGLLDSWDGSAFLVQNAIDPLVASGIPAEGYPVGFGLSVPRQDVRTSLTSDTSRAWLNTQAHAMAASVLDYVMNDSAALTLTVRVDDIKAQAAMTIARDLDVRLGAQYASARLCTPAETAGYDPSQAARSGFTCQPAGMSYAQARASAGITDFPAQAASVVRGFFPQPSPLTSQPFSQPLARNNGPR